MPTPVIWAMAAAPWDRTPLGPTARRTVCRSTIMVEILHRLECGPCHSRVVWVVVGGSRGVGMYVGPMEEIDWEEIWNRQWRLIPSKGDGADYWDRKAPHLNDTVDSDRADTYVSELLKRLDLSPDSSVLDVGCGTGALTIEVARRVRRVTALDVSPVMLRYLRRNALAAGVDNIVTLKRDWLQAKIGHDFEQHDVVLASRCLPLGDLRAALIQMDRASRRRCLLTWPACGDDYQARVAAILGTEYHHSPSYIIIYNLLHSMGIYADVEIFDISATHRFSSLDEAVADVVRDASIDRGIAERLEAFVRSKFDFSDGLFCREITSRWALISWSR